MPRVNTTVIFFLGDGYGMVPITAARIYAVDEDGQLAIDNFAETAFVVMADHDQTMVLNGYAADRVDAGGRLAKPNRPG